ncbi:GtrA family protein [Rhizobium phaseoli]|uniref:GtrA family protein n=1 Tax=Rhizobium phaseoli TaxID=396 RepID=UPI0007EAA71F|nr:GtrA family protein [Rhizobium phaseoli]ANL44523.1 polysaccharide biosynthesis GtrA-like protein [Rhizobium phaseoli]ANL56633.1 polysaccharide biosynthesis GtrA-like protein [Rhizobium phaseoli]ANL63487.1 polysaccharide biosynthesis GtrA-like protein [Rhizobium phaseoli]MDK4724899.1 GtrA family protein [Rhizobium phaseoli]NKE86100.1 GtrA family protein [Rhizobium phaseoli]
MGSQFQTRSTPTGVAARYVAFAVLSTAANFLVQAIFLHIAPWSGLMPSILAGTAAGFAVKYVLDKKWIFFDRYTSHGDEVAKVALYGLFSVLTTVIFWGFEISFWTLWKTEFAKYAGGAIGLAIGYISKYALDRRFVFKPGEA